MGDFDLLSGVVDVLKQCPRNSDGAMTAAGTADCDGKIGLSLLFIERDQKVEQFRILVQK